LGGGGGANGAKSSPQSSAEFRNIRHCTSISLTPSQRGGRLSTTTIIYKFL